MDAEGYHALKCNTGGTITRRHNTIHNIVYQACRKAAWNPALEVALTGGTKALVPADVYVPRDILGTEATAVDITVIHPLQAATRAAAATAPGAGAEYAEARKKAKHGIPCRGAGLTFVPLAIEVFGHIGEKGNKFLEDVAGAIASCMGISAGGAAKDIKRRIAFALIKCHAEAVLTHADPEWNMPGCTGHAGRSRLLV
jgi:hypothetical protein